MRLSYLAPAYKDELIYSRLARTKAHLGLHYSGFFELLTGNIADSIGFQFGSNLAKIQSRFPKGYFNVEDSLKENSLVPFIENFIAQERYNQLLTSIVSGPLISAVTALMSWEFKYCPLCSDQDRQTIGETYWRRTFAVNFWTVCPLHRCYLHFITENAFNINLGSIMYNAEEMIPSKHDDIIFASKDELEIAARIEGVVNGTRKFCRQRFLANLLDRSLIQRGAFEQNFISERDNFIRSMSRAIPDKTFTVRSMSYQRLLDHTNFRKSDPVKLILTEYFVESRDFRCSTLQTIQIQLKDCPCGTKSESLQTFDKYHGISLRRKIVYCPKCYLAYHVTENGTPTSILDYGDFLRKEVKEMINEKVTLSEIAKKLKLTIGVITRIKDGLGKKDVIKKFLAKRDLMRKKFETSMHKTHKQKAHIHTWLTRYDREWLYTRPKTVILTKYPRWTGTDIIPESILNEAAHIKTLPIPRFLGYQYFRTYFGKRLRALSRESRERFYHSQAESECIYVKRTSLAYIRARFEKFGTLKGFNLENYIDQRCRFMKLSKIEKSALFDYLDKEIYVLTSET